MESSISVVQTDKHWIDLDLEKPDVSCLIRVLFSQYHLRRNIRVEMTIENFCESNSAAYIKLGSEIRLEIVEIVEIFLGNREISSEGKELEGTIKSIVSLLISSADS